MNQKFLRLIRNTFGAVGTDIGIDLGTANTLVFVSGKGVILNEPSIVAINKRTQRIVAVGAEARAMYGRTPGHIDVIRPLVDGVISDYEVTEEMLHYLIKKAEGASRSMFRLRPRVVVGVPSGISNVESRAVVDATRSAGAREVYIVEEPMAAAIGVGLPVTEPEGSMIIDIGGGTTDIATISFGGIVQSKNLKIAGDRFNQDIMSYLREQHQLLVGERTSEDLKIHLASAIIQEPGSYPIKGRGILTGLPVEINITDSEVRAALEQSMQSLLEGIKMVLESTPPEILSDIMRRGIVMTGGGALIKGLDQLIQSEVDIKVFVAPDPLVSVVLGTGRILEDLDTYKDMLIYEDDELPRRS